MSKVTRKLTNYQKASHFKQLLTDIKRSLKPILDYYYSRTRREQQLLIGLGIFALLYIIYFLINGLYNMQQDVENQYKTYQSYNNSIAYMAKQYKHVSQLTPNEFSAVTIERITADIVAVLGVQSPDIQLIEKTLVIQVSRAQFSKVMNLINQLRKSYGIYPTKLDITKLTDSGYVTLNISFKVIR